MSKGNKLTLWIIIAMLLGVIVGYFVHEMGGGKKLQYKPKEGFAGKDTIVLKISGEIIKQPVVVYKDEDSFRNDTAAATGAWRTIVDIDGKYVPTYIAAHPGTKIEKIIEQPKHGVAFTRLDNFATNIKLLTVIFLRLVQMIIAPLVFCTLVVGIAKLGDLKTVGRVGGKALLWFVTASLVSLLIGLVYVNVFQPGHVINLSSGDAAEASDLIGKTKSSFSLSMFIEHVIPKSVIESMASNEVLQLVVFSVFFGIAATAVGDYAKPVIKALDGVAHVILKMVGYVMGFAPLGVFGAISAVIAVKGLEVFKFYGYYLFYFLIGIATLWFLLLLIGYLILKNRLPALVKRIAQPLLIAFSTTSSEAVFPKLTEELERFGCKDKIVSFILPLGYSFNLDGSMMYMTFASLTIAQVYKVPLDLPTQLTMLIVLMLTSKGIAGVPRASLVVVTATCAMFKIPPEGIALILPIDHFCDMFRTATNVLGNALATTVVSKWEGELGEEEITQTA
ncbi:dicarboxylate/amino acid:cation symporter [Pinibacter aurantiacus]|uniref:Dicarboxylate/amino acid:cation symporter n=1 Tax=Pinibacter aurantiacus TaxID=2851599 RepID=A0A9E2W7V3_9BACT|nr:dicarboxylate/amino acid:cation symporter [Pinibacter aurantiacus]MBV4356942.1 dicarboxylate/amino acid:cation symporter [Pinibacter aurantiacus]